MSRPGNRRGKARRDDRIVTYRGRLSLVALLTAFIVCAALVVIQRHELQHLAHDLGGAHSHIDSTGILLLVRVLGFPLLAGLLAYLFADQVIRLLRLVIYLRALHRYAARMLRTTAPLISLGYEARVVEFAPNKGQRPERGQHAHEYVMGRQRSLLVGDDGAGKSAALWGIAHEVTRRRLWLAVFVGAAPLPIVAPLRSYAEAQQDGDERWVNFLTRQVRIFSTAGLAARLPARLNKRAALLICDDLDELHPHLFRRFVASIQALDKKARKAHLIVAGARLRHYEEERRLYARLQGFDAALVQPIPQQEALSVLRRVSGATVPTGKAELGKVLEDHHLTLPLTVPATLAALTRVWITSSDLPYGRAGLWQRALSVDQHQGEDALAQLANAMIRADVRAVPIAPGRSLGRAIAEWIAAHPPLFPLEHQVSELSELAPEQIEVQCRTALQSGILTRAPDGQYVQFANRLIHDALAAHWLGLADDGLGRLNAEMLQRQWIAPVLLWGGSLASPGDLMARLVRLADTPEATAIRANLAAREDSLPVALALALGVAMEGIAYQLAATEDSVDARQQTLALAEQHLRDVLDRAAVYISDPDQQDRLAVSLQAVRGIGGPEVVAGAAALLRVDDFSRLTRAQLITMLGVMASPDAVALCVDLLAETDPIIRQAINQAILLAGPAALEPLRNALTHPDDHVRSRAGEALTLLGDMGVETAVGALQGTDARQRAAAVRTVGILGASQAVEAVIARLDDEDRAVRMAAARALGQIALPEAVEALAHRISSPDAEFRAALAKALGATRAPEALTPLLTLMDDQDGQVRAAAATALGVLGDERATHTLRQHRADNDALAQHATLSALRRLGHTA